ncbi:E3 ubiquitin-protein ligase MARCH, partial [archaeon]
MEFSLEPLICRICLDEDVRRNLIAPCSCRGSQRWVHRGCLDKWRAMKEDRAFSRCTECLTSYQLVCLTNDNSCDKCKRHVRFSLYVTRDLFLALLVTQIAIILLSLLVYVSDHNKLALAKAFHMESDLYSFYYLSGLALFLSAMGMVFLCIRMQACGECYGLEQAEICRCDDIVIAPYWCYLNPDTAVCCHCCQGCDGAACCAGDCVSSSLSAMGQELLVLFLMLFVVFAVIGAVFSIFIGVLVIQTIVSRHVHMIQKFSLAQEYVVKDLAEDADHSSLASYMDSSGHGAEVELMPSQHMQRGSVYSPLQGVGDLETASTHTSLPSASTPFARTTAPPLSLQQSRQEDEEARAGLVQEEGGGEERVDDLSARG